MLVKRQCSAYVRVLELAKLQCHGLPPLALALQLLLQPCHLHTSAYVSSIREHPEASPRWRWCCSSDELQRMLLMYAGVCWPQPSAA